MSSSAASFPFDLNASFSFGPDDRSSGCFGTNVLRQLISGIDTFRAAHERERRFRTLGPALLGAFLWLDDPQLVRRIADFRYASVVITKQPRNKRQQERLDKLKPLLESDVGFPARALPELEYLMPHEDREAPLVGPYSPAPSVWLSAVRTVGYRKTDDRLVPILHTKMLLLGELWWHDEDEFGIADVIGFRPMRLWLGSANGTESSRANLEFGVWLDDPQLLLEAKKFLTGLLSRSEELDPDSDDMEPELVEPTYDDAAFAEAMMHFADEYDSEP